METTSASTAKNMASSASLDGRPHILPYSWIVGQENVKTALKLSFVEPRIGGVLISGQRGTAKSTVARAFNLMMTGELPVTLPINATDDRIVGALDVPELLKGTWTERQSLLEEAGAKKLLYVDEVNLLDDHIVNLLLDVVSTGQLVVAHGVTDRSLEVSFQLVGTMNPEEGSLRPQLLDRFGLLVEVVTETNITIRTQILGRVLDFDEVLRNGPTEAFAQALEEDGKERATLEGARAALQRGDVKIPGPMRGKCARVAAALGAVGHRGDVTLARAAQAAAALRGVAVVEADDVKGVAQFVLAHRRSAVSRGGAATWETEDKLAVTEALASAD
jgi:magnesium chelatase subunit I